MEKLAEALSVTAEICGTEFSLPASRAILVRLSTYPERAVMKALERCQNEITGRLSLAAIIQRIDDGRLSADEAWSTAMVLMDETRTALVNDEIMEAFGVAKEIYEAGDKIGARMAFRAAYEQIVADARSSGRPSAKMWASVGTNKQEAADVLNQAVERGLLSSSYVANLLPHKVDELVMSSVLSLAAPIAVLENKQSTQDEKKIAENAIARIKAMLNV